jgi:hypothetical protein
VGLESKLHSSDPLVGELIFVGFAHDDGKYHESMLDLVRATHVFSPEERHRMGAHAPLGQVFHEKLARRSWFEGDGERAALHRLAGQVARDHHHYNLEKPRTSASEKAMWRYAATRATQLADRASALTATDTRRPYLRKRMAAEGDNKPRSIMHEVLNTEYGKERNRPLPILGLSPDEIVDITLSLKGA